MTESTEMKTARPAAESFAPKEVAELLGVVDKSFRRHCENLDKFCQQMNRGVLDKTGKLSFFPRNENNHRMFYDEDIQYLQTFMDLRTKENKTIEEAATEIILQRYGSEILDADTDIPTPTGTPTEMGTFPLVSNDAFKHLLKEMLREALGELSAEMEARNESTMQKYFEQLNRIEAKQDKILTLEQKPKETIPVTNRVFAPGKTLEDLLNEPEKPVLKVVPDPLKKEEPKKEVPVDIFPEPTPSTAGEKTAADTLTAEKPAFKMSTETVSKLAVTESSIKKEGPFSKFKSFFGK